MTVTILHFLIIGIIAVLRSVIRISRVHGLDYRAWPRSVEVKLIVGLGLDISEIDRIEAALTRHGAAMLERLYTPQEVAYCESYKHKFERYAGRFAAKEAAMKALGTGWSHGVRWRDLEVVREPSGRPTLRLAGAAQQIAERMGVKHISLSITHSGNLALAEVIFES